MSLCTWRPGDHSLSAVRMRDVPRGTCTPPSLTPGRGHRPTEKDDPRLQSWRPHGSVWQLTDFFFFFLIIEVICDHCDEGNIDLIFLNVFLLSENKIIPKISLHFAFFIFNKISFQVNKQRPRLFFLRAAWYSVVWLEHVRAAWYSVAWLEHVLSCHHLIDRHQMMIQQMFFQVDL